MHSLHLFDFRLLVHPLVSPNISYHELHLSINSIFPFSYFLNYPVKYLSIILNVWKLILSVCLIKAIKDSFSKHRICHVLNNSFITVLVIQIVQWNYWVQSWKQLFQNWQAKRKWKLIYEICSKSSLVNALKVVYVIQSHILDLPTLIEIK